MMDILSKKDFLHYRSEVMGTDTTKLKLLEAAYEAMSEEYKTILKNEFLCKSNFKWWCEFYSKSTYFRRLKQAMIQYLSLLNSSIDDVKINL